jgi:hypothetical protein
LNRRIVDSWRSSLYFFTLKDGGAMFLRNIGNHSPNNTVTSQKTRILSNTNVETSNLDALFVNFFHHKYSRGHFTLASK